MPVMGRLELSGPTRSFVMDYLDRLHLLRLVDRDTSYLFHMNSMHTLLIP